MHSPHTFQYGNMRPRFDFDRSAANVLIGLLTPGFLMMALAFIGFDSVPKLGLAFVAGIGVLALLWVGFARGTYVEIDAKNNLYRTSGFFMKKAIPLSSIVSLNTRGTFAGLMTEISLTYRDKDGTLRTIGTMNKQSLKKSEMQKFLTTLLSANPNVSIPQELFDK
jgi:hypothetical protein